MYYILLFNFEFRTGGENDKEEEERTPLNQIDG